MIRGYNSKTQFVAIALSTFLVIFSFVGVTALSQNVVDNSISEATLIKTGDELIVVSKMPSWSDFFLDESIQNTFVTHSEFGVAIVGLDGKFLKVNRALSRILGYTESELQSLSFVDVTHPQDKIFDIASANTLISNPDRESYLMLKKYVRKNGEVINCLLEVFIHTDANDNPSYFISKVVPIDVHVVETEFGSKIVAKETEKSFYEFFVSNLPWIITSFLAALSFSILIGRNLQKQIEFNKKVKKALEIDEQ